MRFFSLFLAATCLGAAAVWAQPLEGRQISVTAGERAAHPVPVALVHEGADEGRFAVVDGDTGTAFPATLRHNELVFLHEGTADSLTVQRLEEADTAPRVQISKREDEAVLEVRIDGEHFTSYHYGEEWQKPFLWPVNSEGGVGLTRDVPRVPEGLDHPHHKSLYTAYGDINGVDLWAEGDHRGVQHVEEVHHGSGDAYGWIRSHNVWQDNERNPVIREVREYRFYATPEYARLMDVEVTFTAAYGDAKFGDTKEGGILALRMRPDMSGENAVLTNAEGDQGEDNLWGKPSAWNDFSAELEGLGYRGITMMDHPGNLRHPTSWHARDYGLNGANPFGYSYFYARAYNRPLLPSNNGDYLLEEGDDLVFRYRVYVHSGDAEAAAVAARFQDYASPPAVQWAE